MVGCSTQRATPLQQWSTVLWWLIQVFWPHSFSCSNKCIQVYSSTTTLLSSSSSLEGSAKLNRPTLWKNSVLSMHFLHCLVPRFPYLFWSFSCFLCLFLRQNVQDGEKNRWKGPRYTTALPNYFRNNLNHTLQKAATSQERRDFFDYWKVISNIPLFCYTPTGGNFEKRRLKTPQLWCCCSYITLTHPEPENECVSARAIAFALYCLANCCVLDDNKQLLVVHIVYIHTMTSKITKNMAK